MTQALLSSNLTEDYRFECLGNCSALFEELFKNVIPWKTEDIKSAEFVSTFKKFRKEPELDAPYKETYELPYSLII